MIESKPAVVCPLCGNIQSRAGLCETADCAHIFAACSICEQAIDEKDISIHHNIDYHLDCMICEVCHNPVGHDVVKTCQREKRPISHRPCYDKKIQQDFAARPVTVTQGHLDYLNGYRLMLEPKIAVSQDTDQKETEIQLQRFKNLHEMSWDEQYRFMKKAEVIAAMCREALRGKDGERRAELSKRDREKIAEVRETQAAVETAKTEKRAKATPGVKDLLKLGIDPITAQRMVNREKAIAGLMVAGLSRSDAEKSVDKQVN